MRRLSAASFVVLCACDPAVSLLGTSGTSGGEASSSGAAGTTSSIGGDTSEASSSTGGSDTSGTVATGSTTDSGTDESSSGVIGLDLGTEPPQQSCHALPLSTPGPTPLWCDEWSPQGESYAHGARVAVGADGSVFVTGSARLGTTSMRGWVARYSEDGAREWTRPFSHGEVGFDEAVGVAVAPNGELLVGGEASHTMNDGWAWLTRLTADGDPLWDLDQPDLSTAYRIAFDTDGTFVVVGSEPYLAAAAEPPARISRHAADGTTTWVHTVDTMGPYSENFARGVDFDGAGNIYISGSLSTRERLITKLTPDGGVVWEQAIPGDPYAFNLASDIAVTDEGDIFVGGYVEESAWVARYDTDGGQVWSDMIAPGEDYDYAKGLTVLPGGDVVVVGERSDLAEPHVIWARRYTAAGDVVWDYAVPGTSAYGSGAEDVAVTPEGDIAMVGTIAHGFTWYLWVAKLTP